MLKEFGPELELDLLDKSLPVLHRCITEALRMRPPLIMLLRYAKNDFNVTDSKGQTFVVPKVRCASPLPLPQPRLSVPYPACTAAYPWHP